MIPDKLIAVCRPEDNYTRHTSGEKVPCRATFVVPADNSKMLSTAKSWATGGAWGRSFPDPDLFEHDNTPMTSLRLVGIQKRQEGGLAYKVVTPQGYLVDFREEEFLEVLFRGVFRKDGTFKGKFVWGLNKTQMRVVRVGSELYKQLLEAGKRRALTKIKPKDLVKGHHYKAKETRGFSFVFLGRVRHEGKLKFGWRTYHSTMFHKCKGLDSDSQVTDGYSFVEDLGPLGRDDLMESIARFQPGWNAGWNQRIEPKDLECV